MPPPPEIALLISSYQRPEHLRRALLSMALQRGVNCPIEVVVTDDGSMDETPDVVGQFAATAPFPVKFTTHPHKAFQLARCRNEGVAASTAPYLLFLDGDCILPGDHVAIHLAARRRGVVMAGDCARLDEQASARVDDAVIRSGQFVNWTPPDELRRLKQQVRKAAWHRFRLRPTRPHLTGNNVGIWRADYERVNGYDENFEGYGAEDNDLGFRLRRAGVRVRSILHRTRAYHLWHPREATFTPTSREGCNYNYLMRRGGLVRCRNGLVKRPLADLKLRVVGGPLPGPMHKVLRKTAASTVLDSDSTAPGSAGGSVSGTPEVEVLVFPSAAKFSGRADCNILVALEDTPAARKLAQQAHILVADRRLSTADSKHVFALHEFEHALRTVA